MTTAAIETRRSAGMHAAAEAVALLLLIALPQLLLLLLGDRVPGAVGAAVGLLTLPAAAALAWWWMRAEPGGLGLSRPASWGRTLALGIAVGLGILIVSMFAIGPVLARLFGPWLDPAAFDPLRGNLSALLVNGILISWLHAALCEEIVFRGFFLQRLEVAFGGGRAALAGGVAISSLLFGLAHYPQGPAGMLATALGGVLWATAFLGSRRNLWVTIIGHATMDTTLFVLVFLGQHRLVLPG